MDQLQVLKLPSITKFNAGFLRCNQSFEKECVGPSKKNYEQRMMKMLGKSCSLFINDYNNRLFNWLVAFSLVMNVVGRLIMKFILLEIGVWFMFILETYEDVLVGGVTLLQSYLAFHCGYMGDYFTALLLIWTGVLLIIMLVYWRCYGRRKHGFRPILPVYKNTHKGGSSRPR